MLHFGRSDLSSLYVTLLFAAYQSMEQMLEELGGRWAAVCKWVEDQWLLLQEVDIKWKTFHSKTRLFNLWLQEKEAVLAEMQAANVSDAKVVLTQVHTLKVSTIH